MHMEVDHFLAHLAAEKGFSHNTLAAYSQDLLSVSAYLNRKGVEHWAVVQPVHLLGYLEECEATLAARSKARRLAALRSFERPAVLIAGGADKNLDFSELGREIATKVERIVLLSGTNRGWSLRERPRFMPRWKYWGSLLARTLAQLSGTGRLVLQLRRGAPFVADLRPLRP